MILTENGDENHQSVHRPLSDPLAGNLSVVLQPLRGPRGRVSGSRRQGLLQGQEALLQVVTVGVQVHGDHVADDGAHEEQLHDHGGQPNSRNYGTTVVCTLQRAVHFWAEVARQERKLLEELINWTGITDL